MKFSKLLVALALSGLIGCGSVTRPGVVDPLTISPTTTSLSQGQSQAFEVRGGLDPIFTQVIGCVGGVTSCVSYNLDGLNPTATAFRLERSGPGERIVKVIFTNASVRPVFATLAVSESNRDNISRSADSVSVPLVLVY